MNSDNIPHWQRAYIDIEYGLRVFTEVIDGNISYFKQLKIRYGADDSSEDVWGYRIGITEREYYQYILNKI